MRSNLSERERSQTFLRASAALILCFVVSSAAIPMMSVWVPELSLTKSDVAWTIVSYFLGCMAVLVFLARLSNRFGRRPVACLALLIGAFASVLLALAHGVGALVLARFLQGLSCGLASSAVMSWVVDTAPLSRAWVGPAITAGGPNIGLSLGTLLTGIVCVFAPSAGSGVFWAGAIVLAAAAVYVAGGAETMAPGTQTLKEVLTPKIALPKRLLRLFVITACGFVGAWGVGSFFQGFSAALSEIVFDQTSTFLSAVTYLALMLPNAAAGLVAGRLPPAKALVGGLGLCALATTVVFLTLEVKSAWLFFLFVALCGAGMGATCTSALRFLLVDVGSVERAGVISAVYLSAYTGAGLPNMAVGLLAGDASMDALGAGYIVWIWAAFAILAWRLWAVAKSADACEALRFR